MQKDLVFDTETTGLPLPRSAPLTKQPKIIELGVVVVMNGKLHSEHNWLINPGEPISAEITKITGITNEDLVGKPSFRDLLPEIEEVFADAENCMAHNMPFDQGMLEFELERLARTGFPWPRNMICTAQEYAPLFGRRPRLVQLYERIMGVPLPQTHRALDDARALFDTIHKDKFFDKLVAP